MNKANKITMSRVIMSIIIIVLLLFPFDQMGIDFPTYLIGGKQENIIWLLTLVRWLMLLVINYLLIQY